MSRDGFLGSALGGCVLLLLLLLLLLCRFFAS